MKKFLTIVLSCVLAVSCLTSAACGNKDQVVKDTKTLNVRVFKAGFGADWVYELKTNFETAFKDEGYKVNILTPAYDMKGNVALTEMAQGYDKTGVDLYIIGDVTPQQVGELGSYGVVAEDLRETVFNQKAISYNGAEEEKTVGEKMSSDLVPSLSDDNGVMYGFNWVQSVAGLVVNTKKLYAYGLSLPKTTNELFDCFDKIYCGNNGIKNSEESKTFPVTYMTGSNGYATCALNSWMAQYDLDLYNQFWSFQKSDDNGDLIDMVSDGVENYKSDMLLEALTAMYRAMDVRAAAYGSTTQTIDQAQAKIMKDGSGAVFMFNGDWFMNEVKLNYKSYLGDIEFTNTPVISALGVKLFGEGTRLNLNDGDCDKLLSYLVGLVDENKTVEEMVSLAKTEKSYDITQEEAQTVATARGLYYSRGVEHMAYVTKGSAKKDLASLFLRMMASDDFATTFNKFANGSTPYASEYVDTSDNKFITQANNIAINKHVRVITGNVNGFRKKLGGGTILSNIAYVPSEITGQTVSVYDGKGKKKSDATEQVYKTAAQNMMDSSYQFAKTNWDRWLSDAKISK